MASAGTRAEPGRPNGPAQSRIEEHAIIGDCRSAALVSKSGAIDWLCWPHFSAPSVFAAILDPERGGAFAIRPHGAFTATRRYRGHGAVLETEFRTDEGLARLTDAMAIGGSAYNLEPMREIVRIVEGVEGAVALEVSFEPRPDYGRGGGRLGRRGEDWICAWRDQVFVLRSDCRLEPRGSGAGARVRLEAGERLCFSLSYEKGDIAVLLPLGDSAAARVDAAASWWESWAAGCRYEGRYRDAVLRSAATLKLLTFPMSGAVVAAPTASLPEWIGAERNWDYRYCWLRDAALTMRAFTGLGFMDEAAAFLRWLLHATALTQPKLRVVYNVFGEARLPERTLDHLDGHRGSRPVRIGNAASDQVQLDVYGGVVAAAAEFAASGGLLQRDQLGLLAGFGDTVCEIWREPDCGIWEIRRGRRHYTYSKLMCWAALDRLLALNGTHALGIDAERFARERAAIADAIESRGYNRRLDAYAGELGGDRMDAALLLMPCLDYRDPADARLRTTFARIEDKLGRDGLVYRYEPASDGFASPEGAFGICSFWAAENLARRGEVERAESWFEAMIARANDLGLFAEEIDPETGEALGNFPQAFTHVGLINAALAIAKARGG